MGDAIGFAVELPENGEISNNNYLEEEYDKYREEYKEAYGVMPELDKKPRNAPLPSYPQLFWQLTAQNLTKIRIYHR